MSLTNTSTTPSFAFGGVQQGNADSVEAFQSGEWKSIAANKPHGNRCWLAAAVDQDRWIYSLGGSDANGTNPLAVGSKS